MCPRGSTAHWGMTIPISITDSALLLPAGQDIPNPTKTPSREQIQHTGRRPSLLSRSMAVAELRRIRSKGQTQLFSLAAAPCLAVGFSLKICSNSYFFILETRSQPWVRSGAGSCSFMRLVDGCSSASSVFLQEECSEEHLSAQNSSEMQLCFTALNGP